MPHLNVELSDETIATAKEGAARAGMLLRKWVERAILRAAQAERPVKSERTYEPMEEF